MSFSYDTKAELCRVPIGRKCCAVSECYGLLLYCNTFSQREIRIITESRELASRLPKLFRRAFDLTFDSAPELNVNTGKLSFAIRDPEKLARIFDTFGLSGGQMIAHHVNLGALEDECCRPSFLRGAFLAGGSVIDPAKRYHLELVTDHYNVSRETYSLLLEMGFEPKEAARKGNFINYFKQSSAIEDFLTTVGAPVSAMALMSKKIEKDMRNSINRKVNCDTANVTKTVEAAITQIDAIRKLDAAVGITSLPDKLRETAELRLDNPEMSLSELAQASQLTKSCLNHRMRKLLELAGTSASDAKNIQLLWPYRFKLYDCYQFCRPMKPGRLFIENFSLSEVNMKIAFLVNRDNFETYSPPMPEGWKLVHLGNGEPDVAQIAATGADVLVVDAIMKIGPDIIKAVPKLKLIHSQGVAYNGIDLDAAARGGVYVCNNAGVNAKAVAEQAVLLMLALLRKFRPFEDMVYAGRQMEAKTACFKNGLPELGDMRVGIVGLGAIGMATAERLRAFGCRLSYYSRTKKPESGIEYLPLGELYGTSDIVSLHVPVTPATENMINDETLKQFKRGALLINTARGELVDHEAAARAIVSGQLGGFGADTLAPEPVEADNPFLAALPAEYRDRVALSPHIAGITAGCFTRAYENIFTNIAAVSRGERPRFIVNGI